MMIRSALQEPHLVLPDFFIVHLTRGLQTHIYWSIRIPSSRVLQAGLQKYAHNNLIPGSKHEANTPDLMTTIASQAADPPVSTES